MTIDQSLLDILACPESHQPLKLMSQQELIALNKKIQAGNAQTTAGHRVTLELSAGLIRADHQVAYPIRDDIPVLLVEEGIRVS